MKKLLHFWRRKKEPQIWRYYYNSQQHFKMQTIHWILLGIAAIALLILVISAVKLYRYQHSLKQKIEHDGGNKKNY